MRIRWHAVVATLALMTFAAAGPAAVPVSAHASSSRPRAQAAPPAGADDATAADSVAVIPFTNISQNETD